SCCLSTLQAGKQMHHSSSPIKLQELKNQRWHILTEEWPRLELTLLPLQLTRYLLPHPSTCLAQSVRWCHSLTINHDLPAPKYGKSIRDLAQRKTQSGDG